MASKVEICGVNTSKLPRYRDREMQEMLEAIKAGDERMRDEFIRGNLRLVLSVIQKFSARGENPDDLFQVGCVGLIKALNNFDLSHGVKFSTYAVPMIVGEVRRYLRDNNSIRVSRSVRDTAYRALTAREHLGRQLQREPTVDEIARELELPREDVVLASWFTVISGPLTRILSYTSCVRRYMYSSSLCRTSSTSLKYW